MSTSQRLRTLLESTCHNCAQRFVPWRVWAISRWSCIRCPTCGVALNRRMGWRTFLLFIVISAGAPLALLPAFLVRVSWPIQIVLFFFLSLVLLLVLVW